MEDDTSELKVNPSVTQPPALGGKDTRSAYNYTQPLLGLFYLAFPFGEGSGLGWGGHRPWAVCPPSLPFEFGPSQFFLHCACIDSSLYLPKISHNFFELGIFQSCQNQLKLLFGY